MVHYISEEQMRQKMDGLPWTYYNGSVCVHTHTCIYSVLIGCFRSFAHFLCYISFNLKAFCLK